MTIKVLSGRGAAGSEIARLLGVTEGAVRYQVKRIASGMIDGRSRQKPVAEAFAGAVAHWRSQQGVSCTRFLWTRHCRSRNREEQRDGRI